MTLPELQAMLVLYAAADDAAKRRAVGLVPGLSDVVSDILPRDPMHAWRIEIYTGDGLLGSSEVVCRESELPLHIEVIKRHFPFAPDKKIRREMIS